MPGPAVLIAQPGVRTESSIFFHFNRQGNLTDTDKGPDAMTDTDNNFLANITETVERLKEKAKERAVLLQAAEKAKAEIIAEASKQPRKGQQLSFSFLPVELTRVSPFFPINRRDRNKPRGEVETVIENAGGLSRSGGRY